MKEKEINFSFKIYFCCCNLEQTRPREPDRSAALGQLKGKIYSHEHVTRAQWPRIRVPLVRGVRHLSLGSTLPGA